MRLTSALVLGFVLALFSGCGDDGTTATDSSIGDTGTGDADPDTAGDTGASSVCERTCVPTVAAACPNGPVDMMECVATCEEHSAGMCSAELTTYTNCGEGLAVECDATGMPVTVACTTEYEAFVTCLGL